MDVSILISVHNRLDMTSQCLDSLWQTIPSDIRAEVRVYDDVSNDGTAQYLNSLIDLRSSLTIHHGTERGTFSRNNNLLASQAAGDWLCFLNNDTVLSPNWLTALMALGRAHRNAGVIGNFHYFPQTGRINHAGVVFDEERQPLQLYLGLPRELVPTFENRQMQCTSAACWLVPRESFLRLGGFDESYVNGCEDLDYCMKARKAGQEVWYCGQSRIGHYGQSTPGRMSHDEANHRLFWERWRETIEPDLERFTRSDGVPWPPRSPAYRIARKIWRSRALSAIKSKLMGTRFGVRLRQKLVSTFTK